MGPKPAKLTDDLVLFRTELVNLIDQRHELVRLRTWLGRVIRDVQRKGGQITGALKTKIEIAAPVSV